MPDEPYERWSRSHFYLDRMAAEIGRLCLMDMDDDEQRRLLRIYAVLAFAKGSNVTSEDVHDAWSAWRWETRPDHPCLVPFSELEPYAQRLDDMYRDAIAQASRDRGN